jgi:hypothetical protein
MTGRFTPPTANLVQASIDGQLRAEKLLTDLLARPPTGDEIYQIISQYTRGLPGESDAFLRSFLRRIQKALEVPN